jgi:hypothetical protein
MAGERFLKLDASCAGMKLDDKSKIGVRAMNPPIVFLFSQFGIPPV